MSEQPRGNEQGEAQESTLPELRRAIREDRQRNQERHGKACTCWLCKGN